MPSAWAEVPSRTAPPLFLGLQVYERYGLDLHTLSVLCERMPDELSLNDNGMEFNKLAETIDREKASAYHGVSGFKAVRAADAALKEFVLHGYRNV